MKEWLQKRKNGYRNEGYNNKKGRNFHKLLPQV